MRQRQRRLGRQQRRVLRGFSSVGVSFGRFRFSDVLASETTVTPRLRDYLPTASACASASAGSCVSSNIGLGVSVVPTNSCPTPVLFGCDRLLCGEFPGLTTNLPSMLPTREQFSPIFRGGSFLSAVEKSA